MGEKLNANNTNINEQLGKHDDNHKITKKHIIYVDHQQSGEAEADAGNPAKLNAHFTKRYEGTWEDAKPAASPVSGTDQKKDTTVTTTDSQSPAKSGEVDSKGEVRSRRRLGSNCASMTPSEQALERRRLMNRPKSPLVVLEQLLEEINRLN